jgi:hypothetical protein
MPAEPKPEMTRDEEIRELMKDYPGTYRIAFALMLVGVGIFIGAALFRGDQGYTVNLYTEVLSIAVTVFILDYLNRRRDEHNAERALKEQLVRDAGSTSNEVAKNAIHQLRKQGWLEGENGLLKRENLSRANLEDANLEGASLADVNLTFANLKNADLKVADISNSDLSFSKFEQARFNGANLEKAQCWVTNLRGAYMLETNLRYANMRDSTLENADLSLADLRGADLFQAKLREAVLDDSKWGFPFFDETTILPDGTNWTPGRDMRQFTHPDEWAREHPDTQQP